MSQLLGVNELSKATGLKGRSLGLVLIGGGIAAILVSVPADASIIGLPLGVLLDVIGAIAVFVGLMMVVSG